MQAMTVSDVIPAGHAVFPGHFAQRPIVPGAMLVDRVIAAATAAFPGFEAGGVRRAKFVRVLGPGEAFTIEFSGPPGASSPGSGLKFRVASGEETVAEGQLVASAPPPA